MAGLALLIVLWLGAALSLAACGGVMELPMEPDAAAGGGGGGLLTDAGTTDDAGKLRVTFHHNWWADRVANRMPRVRFGKVHVFNNLYTATGNTGACVDVAWDADVVVENNAFISVKDPIRVRSESPSTSRRARAGAGPR